VTQNIYDDPSFFEGYSRLDRSMRGLEGAPEWMAIHARLPQMQDLRVVDLGCGYGWFCRWARERGAASVLGLDVSRRMLQRARSLTHDEGIRYETADLETLELPQAAFDLAYSSLAFHYIEHLEPLWRTLHQALAPGGHLVFSMEHPIYMASRRPAWVTNAGGDRAWPVDHYQVEGARVTDWLAEGVVKQHRTLGTLINTLIRCGFTLNGLDEWGPTEQQLAAQPGLEDERHRPMMVIVAARR
jgi:SAM-dependent methyltransferase